LATVDTARYRIDWATEVGALAALEPTSAEVAMHAGALATGYNEPTNARLMSHTSHLSATDVIDHYDAIRAAGGRPFLLLCDDQLAGDADLRGLHDGSAAFAFMIASPARQGRGLGTRFALMLCAFAFAHLGLRRVYASVLPENTASRRVLEKLGFVPDMSPTARAYADDPTDVTLSMEAGTFLKAHRQQLEQVQIGRR
jgi:RimJ/RimL family protein N-acetyltransferase